MKLVHEKLPNLEAFYLQQLRVLLSAEEQLVRALPHMAETATDPELKQAFRTHQRETEAQALRLRTILDPLAGDVDLIKCKVIGALIDEAEDMIQEADHDPVRDAALIAAAQRVEHYEIAAYGAVQHFARVLGREEDATLLQQTAEEEKHADRLLSGISERINPLARKAA
jgi:ferritin-like metal-binding protein YciE